jgi:hypothetical protein
MRVPQWLTLGVAAFVIVFGVYRLWLARQPREAQQRASGRRGLFGQARSTQALLGVVYLMLGAALIATSFGWNPLGGLFAPAPTAPPTAPADPGAIRVD